MESIRESSSASVAVIGAGYAGMAAATELASRGIAVTVYESAKHLGGRARAVHSHGVVLDNGAHLLIGAYSETLRLIGKVVSGSASVLARSALDWHVLPEFRVRARALPAPLHLAAGLLLGKGARFGARIGCARFLRRMQRRRFALPHDTTVQSLLAAHDQDPSIVRNLWNPLCLAALNTPAERASARVFLMVLRDSLAASRESSELLLARVDLSALFPEPAARFIESGGGRILRSVTVDRIAHSAGTFTIFTRHGCHTHPQVVCAVPAYRLAALLQALPELEAVCAQVRSFEYEPITTIYLRYEHAPPLPAPMVGMVGGLAQWVFDRGALCGQPGLLAVVISARGPHQTMTNETLAGRIHAELVEHIGGLSSAPLWSRVIEEKRATFACTPGLLRPDQETALPGLYLAGDYTASDYPATIEAAVRSGVRCAALAADRVTRDAAR